MRSSGFQHGDDFIAARLGEMAREKPAVAYDYSKRHCSLHSHFLIAPCRIKPAVANPQMQTHH
jgi:hypothetical protein